MREDEILRDLPDLTREDIRACLAFAADRERKFVSVPPGVRLLLDQNLSPRLLTALGDLFPGSTHVREVGLQAADDDSVWR
jgi:hypothetical protein